MIVSRLRRYATPVYRLHSAYRARQVETRIRKEQAHYEAMASSQPRDVKDFRTRLGERLSARRHAMKASGDRDLHFFYATRPSNWEPHNIPPELARLGHVTCYYYKQRGFDDESSDWVGHRHDMDADLLQFVRDVHRRTPIDIFLGYLSGWQTAPETIRAIGDLGIVTCGYHWDDKLSFRGQRAGGRWSGPAALAAAYDLNLTSAPSSIVKYEAEGGLAYFWPEGANPSHYRPLDLPFEYDVSFVGQCYGPRPTLIDYLRSKGIAVETFGPGWPSGPLDENEMVGVYARSRINLGFGGIGYSMQAQCLKGRDFEVPMSGGLYLTSRHTDLGKVYALEREISTYADREECLKKITYFLSNPDAAQEMRGAGRARALMDHSWEKRFRTLCELLDVVPAGNRKGRANFRSGE